MLPQELSISHLRAAAQALDDDLRTTGTARRRRGDPTPQISDPEKCRRLLADAVERLGSESEPCYSRDPVVSALQSAVARVSSEQGTNSVAAGRRGRRLFEQFSRTDARWAACWFAQGVAFFGKKHRFVPPPSTPSQIDDRARLVLMGDWGSGLPGAIRVAQVARAKLLEATKRGREGHAIHLGDVYYSGWESEYRDRFLRYWPVLPTEHRKFGSWNLNANHDMFSGGHGYFGTLRQDSRFAEQAGSSEFVLQTSHWKFIGLDTAWEENTLRPARSQWVRRKFAEDDRGRVLLSHHYYFSSFEHEPLKVPSSFRSHLLEEPLDAWFWGHEHRGAIYAEHAGVRHGRCVGHGGVPEKVGRARALPPGCTHEFKEASSAPGGPWRKFGLAVVDCAPDRLDVSYLDEDGIQVHQETIRRMKRS